MTMELDHDFLSTPTDLATPEYAALSAGQFWTDHNLSALAAPNTEAAFEAVTRKINGGLNGLSDRQAYWARAKTALGV
jgi:putative chitinase